MSSDLGTPKRLKWSVVLAHAAEIVGSYTTRVTLRQLYYRLVADNTLPNLRSYYQRLSRVTAEARRDGTFPDLLDQTSRIETYRSFRGVEEARTWLRDLYRRDRTEGQPWTIILGVEKAGMSAQLDDWFTRPLGIPHVALGGYASQTLCDQVARYVRRRKRPAVLLYAGDMDPTGEDIDRDFEERTGYFKDVVRVALNEAQVEQYGLVQNSDAEVMEKLERDKRSKGFLERHGSLMQYEVDGLDPNTLRDLYQFALEDYWSEESYQEVLSREERERGEL
jgi:hypothetical protein